MDYKDLIRTAYCCDIKACDDCPSNGRTCCRERTMQELSSALNREMARAEAAESRAEKAERCIEEVNTAILLKSKTEALNAIKRWQKQERNYGQ